MYFRKPWFRVEMGILVSNVHTPKNQSNLFIQVNFHITSFNVVHLGFDDTFPVIGKLFDAIK